MLLQIKGSEAQLVLEEIKKHEKSAGFIRFDIDFSDNENIKKDYESPTLLHLASKYGKQKIVQYLVDDGYNVNVTNEYGYTPLMFAMEYSEINIAKILIEAGADIFMHNNSGICAADIGLNNLSRIYVLERIRSIYCSDSIAIAKKLITLNCSLATAVYLKDASILKYMLKNGYNVDEIDVYNHGCTALHIAVFVGKLEPVKLLLDEGINIDSVDATGQTALFYYNTSSFESDEKLSVLTTMLQRGASLFLRSLTSITPLQRLCKEGQTKTLRLILDYNEKLYDVKGESLPDLHYIFTNDNNIYELMNELDRWDIRTLFNETEALVTILLAGQIKLLNYVIQRGMAIHASPGKVLFFLMMLSISSPTRGNSAMHDRDRLSFTNRLECFKILLHYGLNNSTVQAILAGDAMVFNNIIEHETFELANVLIPHILLTEQLGRKVNKCVFDKIQSHYLFRHCLKLSQQSIQRMKNTPLTENLTLFTFLTVNLKKLYIYTRIPHLVPQLKQLIFGKRGSNSYYVFLLRIRFKELLKIIQYKKQVVEFVSENEELRSNDYLVEMIANFMNN